MEEKIVTTLTVFGREALILTDGSKVWARHTTETEVRERPAVSFSPDNLFMLICDVNRDFMAEFYREQLLGASYDN